MEFLSPSYGIFMFYIHIFIKIVMGKHMLEDRLDAGKKLAAKLLEHEKEDAIVIALPRGGVSVAVPIAQALRTALEVLIVRKLGSPYDPELGIGAIAEDGVTFLDTDLVNLLQVSTSIVKFLREKEIIELERRKQLYRKGKPLPLLTNKTVILVDDGLATGVTAHAALLSLKKLHPKKIIFAVPVCSKNTAQSISMFVDRILCLDGVEKLDAIGKYYHDFSQVSDEEVVEYLHKVNRNYSATNFDENAFAHRIVW
jgi:putative phosphoribosyl transferase